MLNSLARGIPDELPPYPKEESDIPQAPIRSIEFLSRQDFELAIQNALRYFPSHLHADLAPEFAAELKTLGHIYMLR